MRSGRSVSSEQRKSSGKLDRVLVVSNRLFPGRLPEWLLKFLKNSVFIENVCFSWLFVTVPDSGHLREGILVSFLLRVLYSFQKVLESA